MQPFTNTKYPKNHPALRKYKNDSKDKEEVKEAPLVKGLDKDLSKVIIIEDPNRNSESF